MLNVLFKCFSKPNGFPIYEDNAGRKIEFIKTEKPPKSEAKLNKETKEMLKHPQIYRVYWWHVLVRTALEVLFYVMLFQSLMKKNFFSKTAEYLLTVTIYLLYQS